MNVSRETRECERKKIYWVIGFVNQTQTIRLIYSHYIKQLTQLKNRPLDFPGETVYIHTHILIHISIYVGALCKLIPGVGYG